MLDHHADEGVFIRSMATRGRLGGLAAATVDLCLLLDAAGFDVVIIETVGVGQDEVEVARVADVTCLVLVPGAGDDVQAIKAGVMEIADVFVLNKADQPGIGKLEQSLQFALSEDQAVLRCMASEGTGIEEVWRALRDPSRRARRIRARVR
jgi:LAO/AO transport system kinase